jgi:polyphosphate kinase
MSSSNLTPTAPSSPGSAAAPVPYSFFNRDLSWLKFNERVLAQATDSRVPLLERVRFLSIFSSNMDEFFMKRVGYLKRAVARNLTSVGADQIPPTKLLQEVRIVILQHLQLRHDIYHKQILPELKKNGIRFLTWKDMSESERKSANEYFKDKVFPVLTPLAVDRSHPFPFLSNLSVSLGITLHYPKRKEDLFARVKLPNSLPQWVQLADDKSTDYKLMSLQDLISNNLEELFPEMVIEEVVPFRVTRSADIEAVIDDDEDDRLEVVEEELRLRRTAQIVRLEHGISHDKSILPFLQEELGLTADDLYEVPGEISYQSLNELANLNIANLRYKPHTPVKPESLADDSDIFSIIRGKDILVHHPYESFYDSVEKFVRDAVKDPNVLAIKMTLYRAGENNPIIPLLVRAADQGKQVVVVIELQARFDEARNIYLSEMLEKAGVHVIYGISGKKIHGKTILVIRQEQEGYRFYSHIGTGNYNPATAKLYTDYSLFTSDKKVGTELIEAFNFLTGLSLKKTYQKLLVAPVNMRKRFLYYINKEKEFAKNKQPAHIIAKMNSLEDQEICEALYSASKAGVKVDLVVRGFCILKPGIPGLSENIRVLSVIGRFLEHARIYYFRGGAKTHDGGKFYIGSADWMYRNLNNRIEVIAPILDPDLRAELFRNLDFQLNEKVLAWELQPSGEYVQRKPDKPDEIDMHEYFIRNP